VKQYYTKTTIRRLQPDRNTRTLKA